VNGEFIEKAGWNVISHGVIGGVGLLVCRIVQKIEGRFNPTLDSKLVREPNQRLVTVTGVIAAAVATAGFVNDKAHDLTLLDVVEGHNANVAVGIF
jgi:hypothetical protein